MGNGALAGFFLVPGGLFATGAFALVVQGTFCLGKCAGCGVGGGIYSGGRGLDLIPFGASGIHGSLGGSQCGGGFLGSGAGGLDGTAGILFRDGCLVGAFLRSFQPGAGRGGVAHLDLLGGGNRLVGVGDLDRGQFHILLGTQEFGISQGGVAACGRGAGCRFGNGAVGDVGRAACPSERVGGGGGVGLSLGKVGLCGLRITSGLVGEDGGGLQCGLGLRIGSAFDGGFVFVTSLAGISCFALRDANGIIGRRG